MKVSTWDTLKTLLLECVCLATTTGPDLGNSQKSLTTEFCEQPISPEGWDWGTLGRTDKIEGGALICSK